MHQSKKHVAFIACDHGFGHVRRIVICAKELVKRGIEVTVFANENTISRFADTAACSFRIVDFNTYTTIQGLRDGSVECLNWHKNLPSLNNFDLVVCDNLLEILDLRADSVISGGFLWHQAVPDMNKQMYERAKSRINEYKPRMISLHMFASPELRESLKTELIGLCVEGEKSTELGKDLLIACGGTSVLAENFSLALEKFAQYTGQIPFENVWVDRKLMPKSPPVWMKEAFFDESLYERTMVCICRPGVGTLTDSLWHNARILSVHEAGNQEMIFNTRKIVEAGVGEACADVMQAIEVAILYAKDKDLQARHYEAISKIDFKGGQQMADILISYLT